MYIKRRNGEHARIKRPNRKPKTNESFFSTFGTSFKVIAIWAVILMLDFFTDFRFEFLYSCWLFMRTVIDSFRYQGLAFALFFTLISMTSDLVCYFIIPTTVIHLLGSSIVWIQLVWQADRGIYGPTVVMCFLFVYVEIAVRVRDPKSFPWGIDICRPFAAHCIGYPAVTLGFVLKTMVSHHFRVRKQRSVEAQNLTFFALLEEALPKELRMYLKSDESSPKSKQSQILTAEQCALTSPSPIPTSSRSTGVKEKPAGRKHLINNVEASSTAMLCLPDSHNTSEDAAIVHQNSTRSQTVTDHFSMDYAQEIVESDKLREKSPTEDLYSTSAFATDTWTSEVEPESPPTPTDGSVLINDSRPAKSSSSTASISAVSAFTGSSATIIPRSTGSCRTRGGPKSSAIETTTLTSTGVPSTNTGPSKTGASLMKSCPTVTNNKGPQKDEYTVKLELELKQLRSELQSLRSSEINLKGQVQQLTSAERTYRSESSQARQEAEVLQTRIGQLTQRLETDQASLQSAEKRLAEERKHRAALEQQLSTQQPSGKPSGKGRKDQGPNTNESSVSTSFSQVKGTTAKVSQATNTISSAECCLSNGESCITRLKVLEAELYSLRRDLKVRETQLATLKEAQAAADQSADLAAAAAASDRNELMTKLQCLHEENQRMAETLKEEDKMKQELMTAYHSALKEITELNSSLTKKEYQIVELNMRLEGLTPQLCEYVLTSTTATPTSIVNSVLDSQSSSSYSPYLPDARYDASKEPNFRRALPETSSIYSEDRLSFNAVSSNSGAQLVNYSDTHQAYPQSLLNSGFFASNAPTITGDTLNNLPPYSRFSNGGCTHPTNSDFIGSGTTNFQFVDETMTNSLFTQSPPFTLRSPGSTNVKPFDPRVNSARQAVYPNFKTFFSASPCNRPMPVGSATMPPTCSPPPYPSASVHSAGPMSRNSAHPPHVPSYSREFRRPHSSSQLGHPSLEVVVTSAALLCSGLDLCMSNQSPTALNSLMGSFSPLGNASTNSPLPTSAGLLTNLRRQHAGSPPDLASLDSTLMTSAEMPIAQLVTMLNPSGVHHDDTNSGLEGTAKQPLDCDSGVELGSTTTATQQQQNPTGKQQSPPQSDHPGTERTIIRHSPDSSLLESSRT